MALKENYKDDILDTSQNVKRKYQMETNGDGTVSFTDVTEYLQEGDSFGASDLNAMAHAINNTSSDAEHTSYDNTTSGLVSDNVQGAIDEINDNLAQTPITVGGETLSTLDDKLNYLIGEAGQVAIPSLNYSLNSGDSSPSITLDVSELNTLKIGSITVSMSSYATAYIIGNNTVIYNTSGNASNVQLDISQYTTLTITIRRLTTNTVTLTYSNISIEK